MIIRDQTLVTACQINVAEAEGMEMTRERCVLETIRAACSAFSGGYALPGFNRSTI